jgi:hypothetical protein
MSIDRFNPTDLTCLPFQITCINRPLHGKVCIIFGRIGSAPISLAGIGFQHRRILK